MSKEANKNYRVGTLDFHGNGEQFEYFDTEELAYENFIDSRALSDEVWLDRLVEFNGDVEYETVMSSSY